REMGFGKVSATLKAERLGSGKLDFVKMLGEVDNARQGETGMLNFYDFTADINDTIDHVNVGVGMLRRNENRNQIVDASSSGTTWEAGRNAQPWLQVVSAKPGQTNQTFAPFIRSKDGPVPPKAQGTIDWLVLVEKYWGE
ncbi:MAG: hypothetical protein WC712_13200, partial [Candidatus Brocadiia bacterium]